MKAKIRNLVKNPRYRLLKIGEDHYILDMGGPFWKTIFPFFFWMFPNRVYKVDDPEIVKELKAPLSKKTGFSTRVTYAGLAYLLVNLLGSIANYFVINSTLWFNSALLVIVLIFVVFLYQAFNHRHKEKLHYIIEPKLLPEYKLWFRPKSLGHIFKFSLAYVFLLGISILFFISYILIQNMFVLFIASIVFFIVLIGSRVTAEEGTTTVKFKENQKKVG